MQNLTDLKIFHYIRIINSGDVYLFDAVSGVYLRSVNVVSASVNYFMVQGEYH